MKYSHRKILNLGDNLIIGENMVNVTSTWIEDDIKVIPGNPRLLVIAPHGVATKPKDDINTDILTYEIINQLGCCGIINDVFRKPREMKEPNLENKDLNLYNIEQAQLHPTFLDEIKKILKTPGKTLVVWIHGMKNSSAKIEAKNKASRFEGKADALHALIGFGQGVSPKTGEPKNSFTARKETVNRFKNLLTEYGLTTILTRKDADNFRGRHEDYMNQWFVNQGYERSQVESIQLEIREKDFRDTVNNIKKTSNILSNALSGLVDVELQNDLTLKAGEEL